VKASDLDNAELLRLPLGGGILRFGGARALILDAAALGLLRKELVDTLGLTAARAVLTRFGYAHGWRTADALREEFEWDDEREWQRAGGRLHQLQGIVLVEGVEQGADAGRPGFAQAVWRESYEAEQHLLHFGRSEECACWTLVGFASGYQSRCNDREVFFVEQRCVARGDATCEALGRPREEWGASIEEHLPYFCPGHLDDVLDAVSERLRSAEQRLRRRRRELEEVRPSDAPAEGIIARSAAMEAVVDMARRVARVSSTVLVTGESGTGKERVARLVHDESSRSAAPFVAINCGAVTETLVESEFFGHARGAFTGAERDRPGLFEEAHGGTLFLDEVGDLPASMQVKLLRVLQEREVRRVGENRSRPIDVRIVAATNRDLDAAVSEGAFREDLLYRLRVVGIEIPPLRERREDVLPLARFLAARVARRLGCPAKALSPAAAELLVRHDWPGNVRELENTLERALALSTSERIEPDDLPGAMRVAAPRPLLEGRVRPLAEVERDYVLAALAANGGHQTRTARDLRIGTATLYRKLKRWREGG
jgi:DNA-binding NtrC family response regulator